MSRISHACSALAALAALAVPAFAANSPWDGTWKLNEAKSKMTGNTFTLSQSGGMFTYTGEITYKFACDGKEYPIIADRTTSCSIHGNTYDSTWKASASGKTLATTHRELSPDGRTLTMATHEMRPDGSTADNTDTFTRVGTGSGITGTWKNTAVKHSAPDLFTLKLNGDVLHGEFPAYKEAVDTKTDGTPAPLHGPDIPDGVTVATKFEGPLKYMGKTVVNGKVFWEEIDTVSADGKTLTVVSWAAAKPSEKQTFIYEKQ